MKAQMYYKGELVTEWELEPFIFEGPTYTIVSHDLKDFPVRVLSTEGERYALFTGKVWRVCTEDYCYTAIFPSKMAADMFVNDDMIFGRLNK